MPRWPRTSSCSKNVGRAILAQQLAGLAIRRRRHRLQSRGTPRGGPASGLPFSAAVRRLPAGDHHAAGGHELLRPARWCSADRRYVRVTCTPLFSGVGNVTQFNFSASAPQGGGAAGGAAGGRVPAVAVPAAAWAAVPAEWVAAPGGWAAVSVGAVAAPVVAAEVYATAGSSMDAFPWTAGGIAPDWLVDLDARHGESFAIWSHDKPGTKAVLETRDGSGDRRHARFGVILAAAGQTSVPGCELEKAVRPAGRAGPCGCIRRKSFSSGDDVKQVVIVVAPDDRDAFLEKFGANLAFMGVTLAEGVPDRWPSRSAAGWRNFGRTSTWWPFTTPPGHASPRPGSIACSRPAARTGAAILAIPGGRHAQAGRGRFADHRDSRPLRALEAQTPQVFSRDLLDQGLRRGPWQPADRRGPTDGDDRSAGDRRAGSSIESQDHVA